MDAFWGVNKDDWLSCEASLLPAWTWQASALSGSTQRHYPTHNINIVDGDQSSTGETPRRTFSNPQTSRSDSAVQMRVLPSDLLGSTGIKPKASSLICGPRSPTDNRRQLAAARWDSNVYRDQPPRDGKSKSKDGLKALIKNDLAARHIRGFNQLEFLIENEVPGDIYDRLEQTEGSCHMQFPLLDIKGKRCCKQEANSFTVPYESHIGAILGSQFRISAFIRSEACYDIYALGDLFQKQDCFAKAYTIRGTKGKERDARLKNLKRSTNNACLMASIDQNGQKWLVFSGKLDTGNDKDVSLEPLALCRGKDYQLHFPGVDSNHIDYCAQNFTFSKSYASCFHEAKDGADAAPSPKAQRARDRQRRKRQERRVVKAKALEAVKVKNALSEEKGGSVEQDFSLAKPGKLFRKEPSHEANVQCDTKELAPLLSDFNAASVGDIERDETQQPVHSKAAEQSDSELSKNQFERGYTFVKPADDQCLETWTDEGDFYHIRFPEYDKVKSEKQRNLAEASSLYLVENEDECISIPCNAPQEQCVACSLHLPKESPGSLGRSRAHLTNRADLRNRNYTYQAGRGGLLPSYSPWVEGRWLSEGDPIEGVAWKALPKNSKRPSIFELHSRAREMSKKDLIRSPSSSGRFTRSFLQLS